ncbi:agmatine coumaroyltransferase-2-like protein [Cinnamomum micranthum f. kanehirae]|uniref:Agmatine coumaroyltransferase-2-like protein n=1 Tax=Cinnamomum micranthum f. kanehirae TaxID=337451 RepID=A0A443NBY4_9MAGN|nr:agmatine coumaroyltransferase-2-like protein [Cinnamomum micranthum f. kanehirae]
MSIEIITNTIFTPSPSSPPHPLLNSPIPLTIFDRAALDLHIPILYAFKPPMPTNESMKEGLSKALNHFPHLAGRLTVDNHLRHCILLNNAGIRLVETRISHTLEEQLPLDLSKDLSMYYQPINDVDEPLQVQLNRFSCGGMVIGLSAHHRVADGHSMGFFLHAWARLVRGLEVHPLPYHDRAAISVPRNPPHYDFDHQTIEFTEELVTTPSPIANLAVHFSSKFLTQLKKQVMGASPMHPYSTFECLLAHLWKKITLVRMLDGNQHTQVTVAVNGRARLKPVVPIEYFGNLVLCASPCLTVDDLLKGSYEVVAKAIHNAVAKMDDAYFRSFIDFGAMSEGKDGDIGMVLVLPEAANSLCPNLEVDSWLRIMLDDVDFGSGRPCAFLPALLPVEGLLILVSSCEEEGGVDAYLSLLNDQVNVFKQISHTLD